MKIKLYQKKNKEEGLGYAFISILLFLMAVRVINSITSWREWIGFSISLFFAFIFSFLSFIHFKNINVLDTRVMEVEKFEVIQNKSQEVKINESTN